MSRCFRSKPRQRFVRRHELRVPYVGTSHSNEDIATRLVSEVTNGPGLLVRPDLVHDVALLLGYRGPPLDCVPFGSTRLVGELRA